MQQRHAAEGPRARTALVLLHFRVGLQVGTQVGAVSKGPVTVLTSEGALTCLKEKMGFFLCQESIHLLADQKGISCGHCFHLQLKTPP